MYREWPFFRSTLDLIEMVLAKADARIAAHYERQLVPPELSGARRRSARPAARRRRARVLAVTGRERLLADNPVLRRSIDVRNPYVDPINLVQVELLRRLRRAGDDERLRHAFLVTVNGLRRACGTRGEPGLLSDHSGRWIKSLCSDHFRLDRPVGLWRLLYSHCSSGLHHSSPVL